MKTVTSTARRIAEPGLWRESTSGYTDGGAPGRPPVLVVVFLGRMKGRRLDGSILEKSVHFFPLEILA